MAGVTCVKVTLELTRRLAEALRELLAADPDLPSYSDAVAEAEAAVAQAEAAGIITPQD